MNRAIRIYYVKWEEYEDDNFEKETIIAEHQSNTFFVRGTAESLVDELEDAKFDGLRIGNIRLIEEEADSEDYEIRDDSIEA